MKSNLIKLIFGDFKYLMLLWRCDWPANRRPPVSVPWAGGAPSRGTPPTGRHSPSGTLSSTRGVRSDIEITEFYYMFYTFVSVIFLQKKRKHHLDLERRLREREWERERERWWGLSLLVSFSLSRDLGLSSFLRDFSGDCSLTSATESALTDSTTVSL